MDKEREYTPNSFWSAYIPCSLSCDVGKATEGLKNELWRRWSDGKVGGWAHSPTLPLLYLRHSSFSNPSYASPTSQALHLIHLASRPWPRPWVRKSRYWRETLQFPHPLLWRNEASLLVHWRTMDFPLALWTLVCCTSCAVGAPASASLCSEHVTQTSYCCRGQQ